MTKPTHVKSSLYAHYFYDLKEIAFKYGYNLVLHGSMNRDLDLIAIPWQQDLMPYEEMINEFTELLGGEIMLQDGERSKETYHGRLWYIININRGDKFSHIDPQYYLDISLIPPLT